MRRRNGRIGLRARRPQRAEKAPNEHYHVLVGLSGLFMPNTNDVCRTKKDALATARWHASVAREDGETVKGNAEDGYSIGEHESVEITTCTEADCLKDVE